jgi:hypothetical protein
MRIGKLVYVGMFLSQNIYEELTELVEIAIVVGKEKLVVADPLVRKATLVFFQMFIV